MADLNTGAIPSGSQVASQNTGTAAAPNGNTQTTGEAGQGATGTENFLPQGVDLNTLPPAVRTELDRINKEMVRGFTAKTQKLAEDQKKYEGYDTLKQKAEAYDRVASDKDFNRVWQEHMQKVAQAKANGTAAPSTEKLEAKLQEIESKLQQAEFSEVVKGFSEAKDDKGDLLRPDFADLKSISLGANGAGDEYNLLRACVELAPGKSPQEMLENGYKTAKAIRDQILDEGRKQGMGKMMAKVRNSTQAPTITSDKAVFNGDPKKVSVREARELAEKGVVLH